jgi:Tfp pilus assembly protein PilX
MNGQNSKRLKNQRGIAMMVALLALLLLAAIGMGLMFMADTENSVNNNYRDSQKAYFAARAGAENVRLLLANGGTLNPSAMNLAMPSSANTGMIYVENPTSAEAIDPTSAAGATLTNNPYLDNQLCWEQYSGLTALTPAPTAGPCIGSQLLATSSFKVPTITNTDVPNFNGPDALAFKWVRITNKQNYMGSLGRTVDGSAPSTAVNGLQVCWNGKKEVPIPSGTSCLGQTPQQMTPVWQLTSLAVTPGLGRNPGSRRIVQMEVALAPPINPPSAVAAEAPIGMHGSLTVNGYDNCTCTTTEASRPGKTCDGSHLSVFSASGITQVGSAATLTSGIGNGLTTYNPDGTVKVQGSTAANQPWPYDVNQMISDYKVGAQNAANTPPWNFNTSSTVCPGTPANCGTQAGQPFGAYPGGLPNSPAYANGGAPATVYVPGSVQLTGNASGSGILIIDGDLDIHGGLDFYGLILVKGQITFSGGGASKVNLYGAMLAGENVNAQDGSIDGDSIGGSFNFNYDSCALKLVPSKGPPKLLATHEVMY